MNILQGEFLPVIYCAIFLSLLFLGCKAQKNNAIDAIHIQKNPMEEIQTKFNLTNIEFQKIKKSDSIVQELKKVVSYQRFFKTVSYK